MSKTIMALIGVFAIFCIFLAVLLTGVSPHGPIVLGIRAEFLLFALTLIGVALFHHHVLEVALVGLISILILKFAFIPGFDLGHHLIGSNSILDQLTNKDMRQGEWPILLNLFGLLIGFALLAKHFEESNVPSILPKFLPDDWKGGFVLLVLVFILSSFLDNIAAAMIGGTIALVVFKNKVDIAYLAGIIAASNAGGSGSVVGDTTTTMMWIDGVAAIDVFHAYIAAVPALLIFAYFAAKKQHAFQPISKDADTSASIDWTKIGVVVLILAGAIITNVYFDFPALGVWIAILLGAMVTKTHWQEIPNSVKGSLFLLSLVMCASMMPVEELPPASWFTALSLGFISAVFDNIPLTKLALDQGGYDWGMLAYAVGFGGSMIWFGSSAGVALSNMFPHAKSVGAYIKHGWFVALAYVLGFFILLAIWGWQPHAPHKPVTEKPNTEMHH
ncbi:MAG: citrate transporter [Bacteroidetes bacterium]|nr:citrate transporter [Bacteroidota bacterium]